MLQAEGVDVSIASPLDISDSGISDGSGPSEFDGVISLAGLATLDTIDDAVAVNRMAFRAARAVGQSSADRGFFVSVSDLGGSFGIDNPAGDTAAWSGGLTGLTRTAALEWPDRTVRAIDIERGGRDPETIARSIADELIYGGDQPEIGLDATGRRIRLTSAAAPLTVSQDTLALGPDDVVVVSGGARGVTATTMIELARCSGARFALLGRSTLTEEPECCSAAETDAALKKALLGAAKEAGETISPRELAQRAGQVLAGREVRATLRAIEDAGATAVYIAVDITDRSSISAAFGTIRSKMGPITGVVHGAGVLADKLIAELTDDAFDRVFETKVTGLRVLLDETAGDDLKVLCLFSSVAARSGNRGQASYAMANEVLNKAASSEQARRNRLGQSCVVKSLAWGPWDGGMVTPALKEHFLAMGAPLIGLEEGARALVAELSDGASSTDHTSSVGIGSVEVVLGGGVLGDAASGEGAEAHR